MTAATVFGDVSGFTAYIDKAAAEDRSKEALRVLHAIRREMAAVVKQDFGGVRVQFQGDRVQGSLFICQKEMRRRLQNGQWTLRSLFNLRWSLLSRNSFLRPRDLA